MIFAFCVMVEFPWWFTLEQKKKGFIESAKQRDCSKGGVCWFEWLHMSWVERQEARSAPDLVRAAGGEGVN